MNACHLYGGFFRAIANDVCMYMEGPFKFGLTKRKRDWKLGLWRVMAGYGGLWGVKGGFKGLFKIEESQRALEIFFSKTVELLFSTFFYFFLLLWNIVFQKSI